jgi:hypothetical protein
MTKEQNVRQNRKPANYWTKEQVRKEAQEFYLEHGRLDQKFVGSQGRYDLAGAISKYGGWPQMRADLGMAESRKPKGYWTEKRIEEETFSLYVETGGLTKEAWRVKKGLRPAISGYYPGGLRRLKDKLGIRAGNKPNGYWTEDVIQKEAQAFYEQHRALDTGVLDSNKAHSLAGGIRKYPGGIFALREKLGIPQKRKPNRFWNPEEIEEQARRLYEETGLLNRDVFRAQNQALLYDYATRRYPGGIDALKRKLGVEDLPQDQTSKPKTFDWVKFKNNPEMLKELVEKEVREFLMEGYQLSKTQLRKNGRSSLEHVIDRFYPGEMEGLKKALGIIEDIRPKKYWTLDRIEKEAKEFAEQYGALNTELLKNNHSALLAAILAKYPTRLGGLRQKLGIALEGKTTISPDDANQDLDKLLEV